MNMEQLSKSQIVLLTLLVSFVTSIATGIVTVSLMDQAPPAVAQTVNRVIERTIQTVVATSTRAQAATSIVTQEKTIIVKESDLISQAVTRVSPSIVRLYSPAETPVFLGLGVVLDASGTIVTDSEALVGLDDVVLDLPGGAHARAFRTSADAAAGIAYLASATTTVDGKPTTWAPFTLAGARPALGETVVMLAGKSSARIAAGIVTAFAPSAAEQSPQVIETDIDAPMVMPGSPLFNTDGALLGLSTGVARAVSLSGFISSSVLMKPEKPTKDTGDNKK